MKEGPTLMLTISMEGWGGEEDKITGGGRPRS
jgi:hypothetical protein